MGSYFQRCLSKEVTKKYDFQSVLKTTINLIFKAFCSCRVFLKKNHMMRKNVTDFGDASEVKDKSIGKIKSI